MTIRAIEPIVDIAVHLIRSDDEALDTARTLAAQFAPGAAVRDRERRLPWDELAAMTRAGLWAVTVPREHGGAGVSRQTLTAIFRTLAAADPSIARILLAHVDTLERLRTAGGAQQRLLYRELLQGRHFASAPAGTVDGEPDSGGALHLNGELHQVAGAGFAEWLAVPARDARQRTWLALVPHNAHGLDIEDEAVPVGLRTVAGGTLRLTQVTVAAKWVFDLDGAVRSPSPVALYAAAIDAGMAEAALDGTRRRLGAQTDVLLATIGELQVRLSAAETLLRHAARALDAGDDADVAVLQARALCGDIALRAADALFELAGPVPAADGDDRDRCWRDARAHAQYAPSADSCRQLGERLLDLPSVAPLRAPF